MDKKYLPYLTVIPLQIQFSNNSEIFIAPSSLNVFPYRKCRLKDFETIKSHIEELRNEVNDKMGIDIDGIVISIIDSELKMHLGYYFVYYFDRYRHTYSELSPFLRKRDKTRECNHINDKNNADGA